MNSGWIWNCRPCDSPGSLFLATRSFAAESRWDSDRLSAGTIRGFRRIRRRASAPWIVVTESRQVGNTAFARTKRTETTGASRPHESSVAVTLCRSTKISRLVHGGTVAGRRPAVRRLAFGSSVAIPAPWFRTHPANRQGIDRLWRRHFNSQRWRVCSRRGIRQNRESKR